MMYTKSLKIVIGKATLTQSTKLSGTETVCLVKYYYLGLYE